ncbi:hypothetical protein BV25DRAFT_1136370 [Artomyces pyxidatus]|uniref:Uncharacterized protein n=1 Tax=Artomyces pyxidatus TaxID=48021 RepID=A0ACB8STH9_9AGAM|nr:hypothetical protein BV25DRAFT_1136370 [Artomyces pyxidatus]
MRGGYPEPRRLKEISTLLGCDGSGKPGVHSTQVSAGRRYVLHSGDGLLIYTVPRQIIDPLSFRAAHAIMLARVQARQSSWKGRQRRLAAGAPSIFRAPCWHGTGPTPALSGCGKATGARVIVTGAQGLDEEKFCLAYRIFPALLIPTQCLWGLWGRYSYPLKVQPAADRGCAGCARVIDVRWPRGRTGTLRAGSTSSIPGRANTLRPCVSVRRSSASSGLTQTQANRLWRWFAHITLPRALRRRDVRAKLSMSSPLASRGRTVRRLVYLADGASLA